MFQVKHSGRRYKAAMLVTTAAAQSQAVLVKSINISSAGSEPGMRIGDLNGDGRLDILRVQATSKIPSQVQMLTAFDGCSGSSCGRWEAIMVLQVRTEMNLRKFMTAIMMAGMNFS